MNCLIVDFMYENIEEIFNEAGIQTDYRPTISRNEIMEIISAYDGLLIRSKTIVDQEMIDTATKLKFVARAGAGIDNLDVDMLTARGIKIINAPEGNRSALAEHCVGLLLGLINNIVKADREVRNGMWDREGNRGYELGGKVVGLLGCGHMGSCFAEKLKSFDCEVLAFDKYKKRITDGYVRQTTMEEIYERADVFSLHVPLTDETRGIINLEYINRFKKSIYLLNTSRGEVLVLSDLCKAIEKGKVFGAGLDVLENENLEKLSLEQRESFYYLANSSKTILTPHVAGWSYQSYKRINEVLLTKIKAEFNGFH